MYPKGFWLLRCRIPLYNGCGSLLFGSGSLWQMEYPLFLDICKNLPHPELSRTGCMAAAQSRRVRLLIPRIQSFLWIMPHWFLFRHSIATAAAIIASQALISGSFTLISEAMRLNLWPKVRSVILQKQRDNYIFLL